MGCHSDIYYDRKYHDPYTTQYTALHAAALSGNFDLCELLIKHGWSVDATTREGAKTSEIARRAKKPRSNGRAEVEGGANTIQRR